jgi:hypothetical protein
MQNIIALAVAGKYHIGESASLVTWKKREREKHRTIERKRKVGRFLLD